MTQGRFKVFLGADGSRSVTVLADNKADAVRKIRALGEDVERVELIEVVEDGRRDLPRSPIAAPRSTVDRLRHVLHGNKATQHDNAVRQGEGLAVPSVPNAQKTSGAKRAPQAEQQRQPAKRETVDRRGSMREQERGVTRFHLTLIALGLLGAIIDAIVTDGTPPLMFVLNIATIYVLLWILCLPVMIPMGIMRAQKRAIEVDKVTRQMRLHEADPSLAPDAELKPAVSPRSPLDVARERERLEKMRNELDRLRRH